MLVHTARNREFFKAQMRHPIFYKVNAGLRLSSMAPSISRVRSGLGEPGHGRGAFLSKTIRLPSRDRTQATKALWNDSLR